MKEHRSVSKDKLIDLENGFSQNLESPNIVHFATKKNSCKKIIEFLKIIFYVALLLTVGLACYSLWRDYRTQSVNIRFSPITPESEIQSLCEAESSLAMSTSENKELGVSNNSLMKGQGTPSEEIEHDNKVQLDIIGKEDLMETEIDNDSKTEVVTAIESKINVPDSADKEEVSVSEINESRSSTSKTDASNLATEVNNMSEANELESSEFTPDASDRTEVKESSKDNADLSESDDIRLEWGIPFLGSIHGFSEVEQIDAINNKHEEENIFEPLEMEYTTPSDDITTAKTFDFVTPANDREISPLVSEIETTKADIMKYSKEVNPISAICYGLKELICKDEWQRFMLHSCKDKSSNYIPINDIRFIRWYILSYTNLEPNELIEFINLITHYCTFAPATSAVDADTEEQSQEEIMRSQDYLYYDSDFPQSYQVGLMDEYSNYDYVYNTEDIEKSGMLYKRSITDFNKNVANFNPEIDSTSENVNTDPKDSIDYTTYWGHYNFLHICQQILESNWMLSAITADTQLSIRSACDRIRIENTYDHDAETYKELLDKIQKNDKHSILDMFMNFFKDSFATTENKI